MNARRVCVVVLAALGACTADERRVSESTVGPTGPGPGDIAGNQSGTEGHHAGACTCELGEPLDEVAMDSQRSDDYPFAYAPNDIFGVLEGVHTFSCLQQDTTVRVEITRGVAARLLDGIMPSDILGESGTLEPDVGSCRGLELDVGLQLRASNGLMATASKLRIGEQCDARWLGSHVVGRLSGELRASFLGTPADASITITAGNISEGGELARALVLHISYDGRSMECSSAPSDEPEGAGAD